MLFKTLPSSQREHRGRGCPPVHVLKCVRSETNDDVELRLTQQPLPEFLVSPKKQPTLRRYECCSTAFTTKFKTAFNEACRQICFRVWINPFTINFQEVILFATTEVRHI